MDCGDATIVVATESHLRGIEALLKQRGVDIEGARNDGSYLPYDAVAVLPGIMSDGMPDEDKFRNLFFDLINRVSSPDRQVRVFGELVTLLAVDSNHAGALRLERFWNALQQNLPFTLFCAYSMSSLEADTTGEFLSGIVAEHSRVIPAEGYSSLQTDFDRSREIIALQQKATWLEDQIVARARLEIQLQEALAAEKAARVQAETALAQREEFLSIAAHDLRTPITVLSGHAQLTLRQFQRSIDTEPKQLGAALETIVSQANTLTVLIDQLLDVSRLNAGKLSISPEWIDVDQVVRNVAEHLRMCHENRTIAIESTGQIMASADPIRLTQVLVNLIDNALKYSPVSCPVEITLASIKDGHLTIAIRDYGAGVPEGARDEIFERYVQNETSGQSEGLGLGLYIARQIVELHGGTLRGEFPDDGGSCFVINLPADSHDLPA